MDRQTNGGGVAIIVHEDFKSVQIKEIHDPQCESICVKVELQPTSLILYLAYVNKPKLSILLEHYKMVEQLTSMESQNSIVVLGDFNLHDVNWSLDETETYYLPQNLTSHSESEYFRTAAEFLQKIHQLPMYQLSNIKNIASNVLDLVFANEVADVQVCSAPVAITKVKETDRFHPPLEITFEYERDETSTTTANETIEVFSYKRGNYERMSEKLNVLNFAQIFDSMELEEAFEYFYEIMDDLIKENVPVVQIKTINKTKWWTEELQKKKE